MVNIGDKFKEKMPSWVGNGCEIFSWEYVVIGFEEVSYGKFVKCIRKYKDRKEESVNIDIELFNDETFYKKVG